MSSSPNVLYSTDNALMATWDRLFLLVWKKETLVDDVNRVWQECKKFGNSIEKGACLFTIVEDKAPMPTPQARTELANFLADSGMNIHYSALVYEGSGFRAAAVRSVVTGLSMIASQAFPHKVFASTSEGAAWMASQCGSGIGWNVSQMQIDKTIGDIRAQALSKSA